MNCLSLCFLILILFLITIAYSPLVARAHGHDELIGNSGDLIKQICKETSEEESNCINILSGDPKVVAAKSIFEFSKAVLELAVKKGKDGQNLLKKLAEETKAEAIGFCAKQCYDGVVGSFSSALAELKESPDTANYDAKAAGDGPPSCEKALANAHIVNPTISALDHQISLLSNIAFLATSKL